MGGVSAGSFIPIDEGMIRDNVKQVCRGHLDQVFMQVFPAEHLPWLGNGGFEQSPVADGCVAAKRRDLVCVKFQYIF